jgi:phosphate transport system protein
VESTLLGQHIVSGFNEDLQRLRAAVLQMAALVETQLDRALRALAADDAALAAQVIQDEIRVNLMEVEIDDSCSRILATRAPTASDLRVVVAIIKTITDLERIGDEAHKIGLIGLRHDAGKGLAQWYRIVRHLGSEALALLREASAVLTQLDADGALLAVKRDRLLDLEYDSVHRQCITFMIEDPRNIRPIADILWVGRSLERIGDHAKNVCEYVIYTVGGRDVRHLSLTDVERQLQALRSANDAAQPAAHPSAKGGGSDA